MPDYPDEKTLEIIQNWDIINDGVEPLLELLENEWAYSDMGGFKRKKSCDDAKEILELHTYGWSGNEDIIYALKNNFAFWSIFWWKSERGGHYWFEIKEIPKQVVLDDKK